MAIAQSTQPVQNINPVVVQTVFTPMDISDLIKILVSTTKQGLIDSLNNNRYPTSSSIGNIALYTKTWKLFNSNLDAFWKVIKTVDFTNSNLTGDQLANMLQALGVTIPVNTPSTDNSGQPVIQSFLDTLKDNAKKAWKFINPPNVGQTKTTTIKTPIFNSGTIWAIGIIAILLIGGLWWYSTKHATA